MNPFSAPLTDILSISPSPVQLADLDDWGNSTTATTNRGKAVPVTIHMRVFKDEQ